MTKPTQEEFICYALSHAKRETLPDGALLPCPTDAVGTEPWEYLYGTTGVPVTRYLLDERFKNHYSKQGWSRESYDRATAGWIARHAWVCDCQGLLDKFLGTDVTANYCYSAWCTDKGPIHNYEVYPVGCAVFHADSSGRMTHVGFVCGYVRSEAGDLEPLVVEERGIRFGCVITRFSERPWTHRGMPTAQLDFSEPIIIFEEAHMSNTNTTPAVFKQGDRGDDVRALQQFLNAVCYRDAEGFELAEDTKLGPKTMHALTSFLQAHASLIAAETAAPAAPEPVTHTYRLTVTGDAVFEEV